VKEFFHISMSFQFDARAEASRSMTNVSGDLSEIMALTTVNASRKSPNQNRHVSRDASEVGRRRTASRHADSRTSRAVPLP